jgi:hypothetical protein
LADGGAALPAWHLLGVICAASAVTLVLLGTKLTFFNDDWYFLLQRPGLGMDSVFAPHNGHLSALAVLIYKALIELFGLESQLPYRLVLAGVVAALGVVMYLLVNERAGRLLGLVAATIVMFLGAGWPDLLWSFQIGLVGSLATGLAALLVLERDTPRRSAIACLLLVCSILLSDLGIPFIVAAAFAVMLRRRPVQLWIPGVPAVLFGIWWIAYGSDAPSHVSATNLEGLPQYVLDSAASGLASITGRPGEPWLVWGRILLVVAMVVIVAWLIRGGRPSPRLVVFIAPALTFWVLAGAGYIPGREPFANRYQLVNAALLILIAAELFRPIRLTSGQAAAILAVALLAFGLNLRALREGYSFMRDHSAYAKVDLGALEIMRGRISPSFRLLEAVALDPYLSGVTAGRYFSETDAHGSPPVYSPEQIAGAPPAQRTAADHVLAAGYGMDLKEARRASADACRRPPARLGRGIADVEIAPGGTSIRNLGERPLRIGVRRFAPPSLPVVLGPLEPGRTARVAVPRDSVALPWHLTAEGFSALQVCR